MTDPLRARNRLGVVFFPAFDWAISATHPEREERLLYTRDQLAEEGLFDIPGITEYRPELATNAQVERVHFCLPSTGAVVTDSHRASAAGPSRPPVWSWRRRKTRPLPWCVLRATTPCA